MPQSEKKISMTMVMRGFVIFNQVDWASSAIFSVSCTNYGKVPKYGSFPISAALAHSKIATLSYLCVPRPSLTALCSLSARAGSVLTLRLCTVYCASGSTLYHLDHRANLKQNPKLKKTCVCVSHFVTSVRLVTLSGKIPQQWHRVKYLNPSSQALDI